MPNTRQIGMAILEADNVAMNLDRKVGELSLNHLLKITTRSSVSVVRR